MTTRGEFIRAGALRPADPNDASRIELGLTLYRGSAPEPVLLLDAAGRGAAWRHTQAWISQGRPERDFKSQTFDKQRNRNF